MIPLLLTVATGGFESARHMALLPDGDRRRNLHGHGFRASVFAELPDGWAPFPGGEVPVLQGHMQQVLEPLNYALLNQVIDQPTDENIARWVRKRLALPGIHRLAVQSTANQGVDLDRDGMAQVWRRYHFQAAHRLPNVPMGHKCGRMHGHGFQAIVHANQTPGSRPLGIDYDQLDEVWEPLHNTLNHTCLNDMDGLSNPTSELISSWLWARLKPTLPELSRIDVFETASSGANFDGRDYGIWKDFTLDSAVQLQRAPAGSRESAIHGHTFRLRLHLCAPIDTVMGWTVDFGDVKTIFEPVFRRLDHQPLHEIAELRDADTASIAEWIYRTTKVSLPQLVRVELFETQGCGSVVTENLMIAALPV
uniref:6-pyruvoyl tetrahydrobiopterin synthase (PTPS) (Modular protein) n=1 Tax=mine drainage metagenome TaxID=410659 RepID=E6PSY8_9ZZZZ